MLSPTVVIATLAASFLTSLVLTRLVLGWLAHRRILDRPNDRSSHGRPTPRGGGLAVIGVVLVAFVAVALAQGLPPASYGVPAAALALAAVSWRDDRVGVPIGVRLAIQITAVAAGLAVSPGILAAAENWVGPVIGPLLIGVAWVWFVNLFNFMDGIDGLAGAEAASIGLGLLLLAGLGGVAAADGLSGAALAGAALGFLAWNWHPARVFLGDVGSIPLGFLIGWLLLRAAVEGAWAAALILPGYFLIDATLTLVRRAVRGDTPWQAHREHAYQRALARWPRHDVVTLQITALNVGLIGLAAVSALASRRGESLALLGAAALLILIVVAWLGSSAERTR